MAKIFTVGADKLHPSMPWTATEQLWIKDFEEEHHVLVTPANIALCRELIDAERIEAKWKQRLEEAEKAVKKWKKIKEGLKATLSTSHPTATIHTDSGTESR